MKKTIPIEKLPGYEDIEPNMYVVHSEGGPHYFSQCKIDVKQIYKENIWPYVERIGKHGSLSKPLKSRKGRVMLGSIGLTKLGYILHRLYKKEINKKKRL